MIELYDFGNLQRDKSTDTDEYIGTDASTQQTAKAACCVAGTVDDFT